MKQFISLATIVILNFGAGVQVFKSGDELLAAMHKKYYEGPCKCYAFSQKNTHYKGDTISSHSEWHEEINFPDKFLIQLGDSANGNYIRFRNDSAYNFRNHKLAKSRADTNSLLLILGGMYYRPLKDVMKRLLDGGYDTKLISEQKWNGEKVYALGVSAPDDKKNQIWITQKDFRVLRIIEKMSADEMMDMRFETQQKWCKGFVETKVSFRKNGKLEQVEEYYNLRPIPCK